MTETVRVVHVHKQQRRPVRTVGKVLRAGWKTTWSLIPFGGVIQNVFVTVVVLWAYISFWPGDDVPLIPGVACVTEQPAGGVTGVAYAIGEQARHLNTNPPSVRDVQGALSDGAAWAGDAFGEFERALDGADPTTQLVDPTEVEPVPVAADCTCPETVTPVIVSPDAAGIEVTTAAALAAGWEGEDAVTAVAIAGAESTYNPDAENPSSTAKGLWQTMMSYHAPKYGGDSWSDPYANARVAHQIWREAGGWSPWTVYTSGAYQAHMNDARAAVAAAGSSAPVPIVATPAAVTTEVGCEDGGTLGVATTDNYDLPGVKPWVDDAAEILGTKYNVDVIGGVRVDPGSDHHTGLAIDLMVPLTDEGAATGDAIAADAVEHAEALGISYVIWQQRIWSVERAAEGWRAMEDRGSPTANHMDHPHLSFTPTPPPEGATLPASFTPISGAGLAVGTYNLEVGRDRAVVTSEVQRLLESRDLDVLAVQEALTYTPTLARSLPGYHVVYNGRDLSSRDSAVIVRDGLQTTDARVFRLGGDGWPKWNGPGRHHPRSATSVTVEGVQVVSVHLPPGGPYAAQLDQREAFRTNIGTLAEVAGSGPVVLAGDWNASPATRGAYSPATLASSIGATITGDGIDYAMARGVAVANMHRINFGGSDHDPVLFSAAGALASAA